MPDPEITVPVEPAKLAYAIAGLPRAEFHRFVHSLCWSLREDPARLQVVTREAQDRLYDIISDVLEKRRK